MTERKINASVSSSSSLNSSFPDIEDDQTIASILAEDESSQVAGTLGKRLSHLDSIPVFSFPHLYFPAHTTCLHIYDISNSHGRCIFLFHCIVYGKANLLNYSKF
jgi:hypothetical protein